MKDETTGNASDSSFILHPSSFVFRNGPVVQRQRPPVHIRETVVRVHPGRLSCRSVRKCYRRHASFVKRWSGFEPRAAYAQIMLC